MSTSAATRLGRSLFVRACYLQLLRQPDHYPSYHALFHAYRRADDLDPAYCVASVLELLHQATAEEQAFVQCHRPSRWTPPKGRLDGEQLVRHVLHPDQDVHITEIMGLIAPAIASWRAVEHPPSLRPDEAVDVDTDPSALAKIVVNVSGALGLGKPDLFVRPDEPGAWTMMNLVRDRVVRPTLLAWSELAHGQTDSYLATQLGRALLDLWRPHYCFMALDKSFKALKQVLLACLHGAGLPVEGDEQALRQISREIHGRMEAAGRLRLREALHRWLAAGGQVDVQRWAAASELTAWRVGLLMGGDLRVAARAIETDVAFAKLSGKQKLEELVLYGLGEDYFAARRALGVYVREA